MHPLHTRLLAAPFAVALLAAGAPAMADALPPQDCAGQHMGAPCMNGGDGGKAEGNCLSEMCSVPNFVCDGGPSDSSNGPGQELGSAARVAALCERKRRRPSPVHVAILEQGGRAVRRRFSHPHEREGDPAPHHVVVVL